MILYTSKHNIPFQIDAEDTDYVKLYKWYLNGPPGSEYIKTAGGHIFLHIFLLGHPPNNLMWDHINAGSGRKGEAMSTLPSRESLLRQVDAWREEAETNRQAWLKAQATLAAAERQQEALKALSESEKLPPGHLVVMIRYGVGTEHHASGPMGLYPTGVDEILRAVHEALEKNERLASRLSDPPSESDTAGKAKR